MWGKGRRKYGNKKVAVAGERFDSKLEASVYDELKLRVRSGEFTSVKRQHTVELIPGVKWRADFKCEKPDGSMMLCEAKGFPTPEWRIKLAILKHIKTFHVEIWSGDYRRPFLAEVIHVA